MWRVVGILLLAATASAEPYAAVRAGSTLDLHETMLDGRFEAEIGATPYDDLGIAVVGAYSHDRTAGADYSIGYHDLAIGPRVYAAPRRDGFLAVDAMIIADHAANGMASTWRRGTGVDFVAGANVTKVGDYRLQFAMTLSWQWFPPVPSSFGLTHGVDTGYDDGESRFLVGLLVGFVR